MLQFEVILSVAQAFTPGNERGVSFKGPINGALIAPPVSHPGVNAWARENSTVKSGRHSEALLLAIAATRCVAVSV